MDNFLGIGTGLSVPVGSYDRDAARWVPEQSGRVIKILSTTPVQIAASSPDTTTSASPALLDSLGISAAELARLGTLYAAGETLWRIEVTHFSPWDLNFSFFWPRFSLAPLLSLFRPMLSCQSQSGGSIIGCEGQTLGEDIGIAGTPFTLHYQSDRTPGYAADRRVELPALTPIDTVLLAGGQEMATNEFPSHVAEVTE